MGIRALVSVVVLLSAAPAAPAAACYCVHNIIHFRAPHEGETGVPLNARLWVGHYATGDESGSQRHCPILLDDEEAELPGGCSTLTWGDSAITIFTPDAELEAQRSYTYLADGLPIPFTTGAERDVDPPRPPIVTGKLAHADGLEAATSTCAPSYGVHLYTDFSGVLQILDVDDGAELDVDGPGGWVGDANFSDSLWVGTGACDPRNWPDASPLAETTVQVGAFDLAGHFSGFGDPVDVAVPPAGCFCASSLAGRTTGPAPALVAVALLLALGVRLRRR